MTSYIASLCVLPLLMFNEHTYARIYAHIRQWRWWWWKLNVNMHCKQITSYNDYLLLKCRQEHSILNIAIQTSPPLFHIKSLTFVGQICILLKYEHLIRNRICWIYILVTTKHKSWYPWNAIAKHFSLLQALLIHNKHRNLNISISWQLQKMFSLIFHLKNE